MEKEYFEILLEDMRDSIKAIAEGHSVLDNKIDNVSHDLRATRNELVTMIKWTYETLSKKIEEGDSAVVERLTKQIRDGDDAIVARLTKQIKDGDDTVVAQLSERIDSVKDVLKAHTEKIDDHEQRLSGLEHKHSA